MITHSLRPIIILLQMAALLLGVSGSANAGLIIAPVFDNSITGSANSAAIEAAINAGIGVYQSLFTDGITVKILFRYGTTYPDGSRFGANALAASDYTLYSVPYNIYLNALILDRKTQNDAMAVASLPGTPLAARVDPSSADGRAVGLNTPGAMNATGAVGTGGTLDGIVTLNSAQPWDFDRSDGITPGSFDALRVLEHEIDEVLGLGSILPNRTDFTGSTAIRPQDFFRYSAPGVRSLTPSSTASAYFSIDGGKTKIVGFNQNPNGDYGDWLSPSCSPLPAPLVQYALTCANQIANISAASPEGINLDVIGYDGVPEPGSMLLLLSGVALLASDKRRWSSSTPRGHMPPVSRTTRS